MATFNDPAAKLGALALGTAIIGAGLNMAWSGVGPENPERDRGPNLGKLLTKAVFDGAGATPLLTGAQKDALFGAGSILDLLK